MPDSRQRVSLPGGYRRLRTPVGMTMRHVTRDRTEAMTRADRVVLTNAPRIEQIGPPMDLCRWPAHPFLAGFVASAPMNLCGARLTDFSARPQGGTGIALPAQRLAGPAGPSLLASALRR